MSQATLSPAPYRNSNLFSGYYLEERVDELDDWDCDAYVYAHPEEFDDVAEASDGETPACSTPTRTSGNPSPKSVDAEGAVSLLSHGL